MNKIIDHYAVMGNPIKHSLSPKIHQLFAQQTAQAMDYVAIPVPIDDFVSQVQHFAAQNGKGLNITLPFKTQAYEFVDEVSTRAEHAKVVNTIAFRDGYSYGDNTDGIGLVRDLEKNLKLNLKESRVLLCGAGGAIRGILPSLLAAHPKSICISNRTVDKANILAEEFSNDITITSCNYSELDNLSFDLIINGTAASLYGESLPFPPQFKPAGAVCYDLAYNIKDNLFLTWAVQNGARVAVDGLGMLVEQAAEAFYLWRGVYPDTGRVLAMLR